MALDAEQGNGLHYRRQAALKMTAASKGTAASKVTGSIDPKHWRTSWSSILVQVPQHIRAQHALLLHTHFNQTHARAHTHTHTHTLSLSLSPLHCPALHRTAAAGISRKLHLRLRMDGLQTYAAFPKLTLIGLAAVLPSLLHTAVRVFAWEHAYVSGLNFDLGPGLGALLPAGLLGVIVIAYLTWHSMLGCVYEHQPQEQQAQGGQGGLTGWTEGSRPSSADTDKEWGAIVRA
eukprot:scaffold132310_cov23-Tisochrysis_lutea.AAC.2